MYEFHICKNICGSISLLICNCSGTIFLFLKLLRYIEMTAQYTYYDIFHYKISSILFLFLFQQILLLRIEPKNQ